MIRPMGRAELDAAAALAALLWPDGAPDEHREALAALMATGRARIFLKYEAEIPVGFAQCQLRSDYVEGTHSSPVGYLEGIFVKEEYRRRGFARELLSACEQWAREAGCTEFASDCELDNTASRRFHQAVHFKEANRIVCFTRQL